MPPSGPTPTACRAVDVPWKSLCKVQLGDVEAAKFKQAIVDDYYFEMLLGAPAARAHVCDAGLIGESPRGGRWLVPRRLPPSSIGPDRWTALCLPTIAHAGPRPCLRIRRRAADLGLRGRARDKVGQL